MADGLFYNDLREPFVTVPPGAVTLATGAKALYTASQFPVLGGHYFARVGKKIKIELFGVITTVATPGNGSFNVYYGSGADATGALLMTGTPAALTANQAGLTWTAAIFVECITTGSAGSLRCTGTARLNEATQAAEQMLPTATAAAVGSCDLTAANIISVQYLRSGSTAETMQVIRMEVTALN